MTHDSWAINKCRYGSLFVHKNENQFESLIHFKSILLVSASCIDMIVILNMKSSFHPSEGEMNFDSNKYSS